MEVGKYHDGLMVGLLTTVKGKHAIGVIVDKLTKSAHFQPVKITYSMNRLTNIYLEEIIRLHRVLVFIISDSDIRFTFKF